MIKLSYLMRRLSHFSRQEFQQYTSEKHPSAVPHEAMPTLGMKRYVQVLLIVSTALACGCTDDMEDLDRPPITTLIGANILDGTGAPALAGGNIIVEGDRISCVGTAEACPVSESDTSIDLTGKWVTPGLVDTHVHFSQTGWLDGRPDGVDATAIFPYDSVANDLRTNPDRFYRSYLCSGITAVYDVGGQQWTLALGEQAENNPNAVHVRAAGPLVTHAGRDILNTEEYDTFLPMSNAEEGRDSVRKVKGWGSTAVKVWFLAPEEERRSVLDEAIMAVGEEARVQGLPLIVHATTLREAKVAIRAGASLLVHSVFSEDVDDEFIQLLTDNDVIYTPTIVVIPNWVRAVASVALNTPNEADDPNRCVDQGTRDKIADVAAFAPYLPESTTEKQAREALATIPERLDQSQRNLLRVYEAGVIIATGTDAGNPLTLHGPSIYSEMEMMQDAGIPAADVLVMSTRNGADTMDRLDDIGTLEPGKIADLLVLDADPSVDVSNFRRIVSVMRAGVMHPISELSYGTAE